MQPLRPLWVSWYPREYFESSPVLHSQRTCEAPIHISLEISRCSGFEINGSPEQSCSSQDERSGNVKTWFKSMMSVLSPVMSACTRAAHSVMMCNIVKFGDEVTDLKYIPRWPAVRTISCQWLYFRWQHHVFLLFLTHRAPCSIFTQGYGDVGRWRKPCLRLCRKRCKVLGWAANRMSTCVIVVDIFYQSTKNNWIRWRNYSDIVWKSLRDVGTTWGTFYIYAMIRFFIIRA